MKMFIKKKKKWYKSYEKYLMMMDDKLVWQPMIGYVSFCEQVMAQLSMHH